MMGDYTWFTCFGCGCSGYHKIEVDPTSSTGCCKYCGDDNWALYETNVTEKAVFTAKLKGKTLHVETPKQLHAIPSEWKVGRRIA